MMYAVRSDSDEMCTLLFFYETTISLFRNIIPNIQQLFNNKLQFNVKTKTSLKSLSEVLYFIYYLKYQIAEQLLILADGSYLYRFSSILSL